MHCGRSRFAQSEYGLSPEWHLTWTQSYRHPGAGRDPDAPMAVAFLDSGLRRNDDQCLRTGLSWLKFKYHSISPPLKTPSTRFPQEFQTAFGRSAVQDAKAGGWGEGIKINNHFPPHPILLPGGEGTANFILSLLPKGEGTFH